jgi:hypothetical protein
MHLARGLTIQLLLGIAFEARLRTVAEHHEPCMPPLSSASLAYVLSGFGVGVLVGMTGVGGGSLMTPLLVLLFGIHPVTAVANTAVLPELAGIGRFGAHHSCRHFTP